MYHEFQIFSLEKTTTKKKLKSHILIKSVTLFMANERECLKERKLFEFFFF